jgi:hypothetical protein
MIDSDRYCADERYAWTRAACFGIARTDVSYDMIEPSLFTDLVEQEGVTDAYVCRLLPVTCLPDITEANPQRAAAAFGAIRSLSRRELDQSLGGARFGLGALSCSFDLRMVGVLE